MVDVVTIGITRGLGVVDAGARRVWEVAGDVEVDHEGAVPQVPLHLGLVKAAAGAGKKRWAGRQVVGSAASSAGRVVRGSDSRDGDVGRGATGAVLGSGGRQRGCVAGAVHSLVGV